jgi:hypothetical protein
MATETLPPVARKVYAVCKKCGVDRYHVVIAHTSTTAAKLQCEVCNAKSVYKLEGASKKKKKAVSEDGAEAAPPKSARKTGSEKRWRDLRDKTPGSATAYTMKAAFLPQTSIQHPKFGLGIVVGVTPQSITVVFEDGERSLVHNRS